MNNFPHNLPNAQIYNSIIASNIQGKMFIDSSNKPLQKIEKNHTHH